MGGEQHCREEFVHLVYLEAEPALPSEESGVCKRQSTAAGRCGSLLLLVLWECNSMLLNYQCVPNM